MGMYVDNEKMIAAKEAIDKVHDSFKTAGETLVRELTKTLGTFEGDAKDALMERIGASGVEKDGTLVYFIEKQVPGLLEGLSQLLDGNRKAIEECDSKLAEAIRK